MESITRSCIYFEKAGKHNTDRVVSAVQQRLAQGDIHTVIVASTTGCTALKFCAALQGRDDVPGIVAT
jgi:hypothetical protein